MNDWKSRKKRRELYTRILTWQVKLCRDECESHPLFFQRELIWRFQSPFKWKGFRVYDKGELLSYEDFPFEFDSRNFLGGSVTVYLHKFKLNFLDLDLTFGDLREEFSS